MPKRERSCGILGICALAAALTPAAARPAAAAERVTLFVVSEWTDTVGVYRGRVPDLKRVKAIKVGRNPHNLGISPDGRWVAAGDRLARQISIIDARRLERVAKIPTGRHPHDLGFSPDSRRLYVGHERASFIGEYEVGTWKKVRSIEVGAAQHDISVSPDGRALWFTVTHRAYRKGEPRVGIVKLAEEKPKVEWLDSGRNAHDVIFSPDGWTVWVTNGGFIGHPDPWVHVVDAGSHRVLAALRVGLYPFHAPKRGRDGSHVRLDAKEMWFSDRRARAIVAVDLARRKVAATVPVGAGPFHIAATAGSTLFVANHDSNTVSIVEAAARKVIGTLRVAKHPHGLAVRVER